MGAAPAEALPLALRVAAAAAILGPSASDLPPSLAIRHLQGSQMQWRCGCCSTLERRRDQPAAAARPTLGGLPQMQAECTPSSQVLRLEPSASNPWDPAAVKSKAAGGKPLASFSVSPQPPPYPRLQTAVDLGQEQPWHHAWCAGEGSS